MRDAVVAAERCLGLNPSYAGAYRTLALQYFFLAEPSKMLEYVDHGIRLSPRDPETSIFLLLKGWAYLDRRRLRATKMGKAADLVEQAVHETLTYYGFPDIRCQKIRTNNPLERIMKEIRRRTRVVGAFPDGQSCLNLAAARLRHIAGTTWSAKCYMNMRPLYQQQQSETEAVA